MPIDIVPSSVGEVQAALERIIHYPGNVGLEVRSLDLPTERNTPVLMVYIGGLADEAKIRDGVVAVLSGITLSPGTVEGKKVELPRIPGGLWAHIECELPAVISSIVHGQTALFIDGADHAVVVQTKRHPEHPAGTSHIYPSKDLFSRDLIDNLALLRTRLRDPNVVAEPIHQRGEEPGQTALVYMKGRVDPDVLRRVRERARSYTEERIRSGELAGQQSVIGLVPTMMGNRWPDKVEGH